MAQSLNTGDILGLASTVVKVGAGIVSGVIDTCVSRVKVGIEVTNMTRFTLNHPCVTIEGGMLPLPPTDIFPSHREIMTCSKTSFTTTGSYGTVSWRIHGKKRRVVIMWSAPFNFDFYSNKIAVGITDKGCKEHSDKWFDLMYEKTCDWFRRETYRKTANTVIYRDNDFQIRGIMATTHQTVVRITVVPLREDDLAAPIKACLYATFEGQRRITLINDETDPSDEDEVTTPC